MAMHIGKIIQAEVEHKRLTQKEFGALIHKNEKTVPDIYSRSTMSIDLLITISLALKKDFLKFFYEDEPMKSIRSDETIKLRTQIQSITEENKHLLKELTLTQEIAIAHKEAISLIKAQIEQYKTK
jgi:hypothetical protein